ncbi:LADA_0D11320g1_1 [Lachancea dasiensis]|uniref:LADA_0D11320g1_1 n=1 Tax=Lachancea dasiensis TaxID=1072105 RepID=A0A1G4J7V1_9SACH|nr:LADA_0D11320g1_1 [Lachancea dasiensis]
MAMKYPSHVVKLFQAGAPIQYKKPVDYPIEQRKTANKIQGLKDYLSQLSDYSSQHAHGSENRHLDAYDAAELKRQSETEELQNKLSHWNAQEDANVADSDPYRTIFIGRLPYSVTEVELQKHFIRFGEIEKVRVVRDKTSGKSRGYGFITFLEETSARTACREIGVHRGMDIEGRQVIVDIERGRTVRYFTPRRLGGGLGGRGYMKRNKLAKLELSAALESREQSRDAREGPKAGGFPRSVPPRSRFSGYKNTTGPNASYSPGSNQWEKTTSYRSRSTRTNNINRFSSGAHPEY